MRQQSTKSCGGYGDPNFGGEGVSTRYSADSARSLRLADGPDEVHKGMIAKLEFKNVAMVVNGIKKMAVIDIGGQVRHGEELDISAVENWLKNKM